MNQANRFVLTNLLLMILLLISCNNNKQNNNQNTTKSPESEENSSKETCYTIAFYNIENLFDTENDPNKEDDEYTPSGKLKWTDERLQKKLKNTAKVISSINNSPDIIGFAEIENTYILKELVKQEKIKQENYKIIHFEGNDSRGIDVALLYKEKSFTLLEANPIKVEGMNNSRDILFVKGVTNNNDTLYIFVLHATSRRVGTEESENKRIKACKTVRNAINKITQENSSAKIIVMGDFNDEPNNKSLKTIDDYQNGSFEMVNLMEKMLDDRSIGTAKHKNDWLIFDQILVSNNLIENNMQGITKANGFIFDEDWIMFENKKSKEISPNRTYVGNKYVGGYSDHLPVYVNFECN